MAGGGEMTFLGIPAAAGNKPGSIDAAIIGAPQATPYEPGKSSHSADAPAAIRAATQRYRDWHNHHDFDAEGPLLDLTKTKVVDCGDVPGDAGDPEGNRARITAATRHLIEAGAVPIVLGGDDSVPIPVFAAFEGRGPLWIVQVDAHIDWRQSRNGVELGWSSTMRRASEMAWIEGIVQVGIRGVGSATTSDVRDATSWGAKIVTARMVHERGVASALRQIPVGARCIISLDCDGIDPGVMPAVMAPAPGGLTYWQVIELIQGIAGRGRIVGFNLVELAPSRDIGGVSALMAARFVCAVLAAIKS